MKNKRQEAKDYKVHKALVQKEVDRYLRQVANLLKAESP